MTALSDYNQRKRQAMLDALRHNTRQPQRKDGDPFDPAYRVTKLSPERRSTR